MSPPTGDGGEDQVDPTGAYVIVDSDQDVCYDNGAVIPDPAGGEAFHGQDAQFDGSQPSYVVSDDSLTVYDEVTGLTWVRSPDTDGNGELESPADKLTWTEAQAYPAILNAAAFGGYDDWRLPNAKELQSIVDYTRSPATTGSAAIDPVFHATAITNEAGAEDYAFYWSGTTHANSMGGGYGAYVAFGRSLGYMNNNWVDVHGAGSQRSDPKEGDPTDFPAGHGPQGDAIRINNMVRVVRGG
jgi:hypothetical protein